MKSVSVLIAGGGPVGMTLANVLAHFGIRSMVVERNTTTTRHPKMDITNSRSMELFRRFHLSEALRNVAVPEDHSFDVSWITSLAGYELHRFRYMAPSEFRKHIRIKNDGTQPLEPPMRVSQVEIEPVLKKSIDASPEVEVRFGKLPVSHRLRRRFQPRSGGARHPVGGTGARRRTLHDPLSIDRARSASAMGRRLALPIAAWNNDRPER